MDSIISDESGTPLNHEDVMFSPVVEAFSKVSQVPQSFFALEDSDDEDTVVASGPVVRNRIIVEKIITQFYEYWENSGTDKEKKLLKIILDTMLKEFNTEVDEEIDGIAMIIFSISKLTKGTAHCLIIFHKGRTLLLETFGKKQVRHSWEEPVGKTEMLKIMDMKQTLPTVVQDLRLLGSRKLKSIRGPAAANPSISNNTTNKTLLYFTFFIPQDADVFSHFGDEKHNEYCWQCHVTIKKVKKSTCAGCLVARYCTLGCQEEDWSRHRDYCLKKKARREEKNMSKMRENLFIDWEKEVD